MNVITGSAVVVTVILPLSVQLAVVVATTLNEVLVLTVTLVLLPEVLLLHVYVLAPLVVSVRVAPVHTGFCEATITRGGPGTIAWVMLTVEV